MNSLFAFRSRLRNTIYHVQNADWAKIRQYQEQWGKSSIPLLDLQRCSWVHGASFHDYYHFRFFEKNNEERRRVFTTSLRYELTCQVNDESAGRIFRDKRLFYEQFRNLLGREFWRGDELVVELPSSVPPEKLVIKEACSGQGRRVYFPPDFHEWEEVLCYMREQEISPRETIVEERLEQHEAVRAMAPKSLNTLCVITYRDGEACRIWGVYLRLGIDSNLDNLSVGGIGAPVDNESGVVTGPAYFLNSFITPIYRHPETDRGIEGFRIPWFDEVKQLVARSSERIPEVRLVGWDVAILPDGPVVVEGNNAWWHGGVERPWTDAEGRKLAAAVCDMNQVYA